MTITSRLALVACLAVIPALAACSTDSRPGSDQDAATATEEPRTALGRTVANALEEARQEMATENISVSGDMDTQVGGTSFNRDQPRDADGNPLPKAEISPQGDLLIDGKTVSVTPEQRKLLLDYRGHILEVVSTGMTLGAKGADLGMEAAGGAIKSIFTGEMDAFEQRIEAQAAAIETEALKICDRLPAMLDSQQALAASLPEFRPYATMTEQDVDECGDDSGDRTVKQHAVRETIREEIRDTIRGAAGAVAQQPQADDAGSEELSAAEEAEAAGR
ncbi:MAG: hypothetical protein A2579_01870 [Lysobacterales bacterium RIFOXYD1_FULL_69_11]|nr:MAG: hypothetical protein A2190_09270 [Xanthomonadales bacterium RIFOXYA1_FULL_69_10]OHE88423.1 MAG: hypothetical protein A2579_01870 [Xanthomonadales bacterium RIFOXYD1_FULL_69_11]